MCLVFLTFSISALAEVAKKEYFATLNYAPFDLILPSKFGLTAGLVTDPDKYWELEYLKSSVSVPFVIEDIGEMSDERLSLIRRDFVGNSTFNFSYGLSYYRFKVHIGSRLLASASASAADVDLIHVESLGFNFGLGHRWVFANRWMLAIDWAAWSQPVFTTQLSDKYIDSTNNEDNKDTVNTAAKLISWVPRITLLKLQVGYSF